MREAKLVMKKGGRVKGSQGRDASGHFTKSKGALKGIPSPVGTPPHRQTSHLANSINVEMTATSALVGPTGRFADYGAVHEFSKRFPRKFMRPAMFATKDKYAAEFKDLPLAVPQGGHR
jgi:phage gpG-like protein